MYKFGISNKYMNGKEINMATITQLKQSIKFIINRKEIDLKELDGDKISDYALWILDGHRHLDVALDLMELELDKRLYQE